jgi:hypothetical protein
LNNGGENIDGLENFKTRINDYPYKSSEIKPEFSAHNEGSIFQYINSLLRDASVKSGPGRKLLQVGKKSFSPNESIVPLPAIRSLGINSNLFSKVNSLRIYGSGRLDDYFYRTKLKHILKIIKISMKLRRTRI